ncbi:MAG: hypothetical protein ACR2FN_12515 [Chitinophagaceae bacterium]
MNVTESNDNFYNEFGIFLICITLIIYCIAFFRELLLRPVILFLYRAPMFWVTTGILLGASGYFIFSVIGNFLWVNNDELFRNFWMINLFTNILSNILFAKGMLCYSKQ